MTTHLRALGLAVVTLRASRVASRFVLSFLWRSRPWATALALFPGLAAASFAGAAHSPAGRSATSCQRAWGVSPVPAVQGGYLNAVTAISPDDVWAVGARIFSNETLIAHWDGQSWHLLPAQPGTLAALSALSNRDIWAVGTTTDVALKSRPLLEHWDGTRWTRVGGVDARASQLYGAAALDNHDVWAVGGTDRPTNWVTFVEHWDGTHWRQVATPAGQAPLTALKAFSRNDIWAVGWSVGKGDREGLQHWNGRRWSASITRHFGDPGVTWYPGLADIAGASANDLWAVGSVGAGPLVEHLTHGMVRVMDVPLSHFALRYNARTDSALNGVVALSANDVWMVGFGIEHWNGRTLRVSNVMKDGQLFDISAAADGDLWAVGTDAADHPLVLRYTCRH